MSFNLSRLTLEHSFKTFHLKWFFWENSPEPYSSLQKNYFFILLVYVPCHVAVACSCFSSGTGQGNNAAAQKQKQQQQHQPCTEAMATTIL